MKLHLLLISILLNVHVFAKEIIVVSESWEGATNRDGTGLYWDIVAEVYKPLGFEIVRKHTSYTKAVQLVEQGRADFWLAAYKDEKPFALYPKYYFDQDIVVAMYRTDAIEKWQGQKSLEGLRVGWVRDYSFDKYLKVKVRKEELNGRVNGLKLLKSERIDAFLDDRKDLAQTMQKYTMFSDSEYTQKIVMQLKLYPAFADTSKGRELMRIWDERMKQLIETDAFKEIYFNSEYTLFPY